MSALPTVDAPAGGWVADFMQHRVERALRQRARYRYVRPRVLREGDALRIESPCCSRNVDPAGGVIDIALLRPADDDGGLPPGAGLGLAQRCWNLYARDHVRGAWSLACGDAALDELLDLLCTDPDRVFWP